MTGRDGGRRVLVLIDLQEDFLAPPALRERRDELVQGVQRWIDWSRDHDLPVFEVRTVLPHDRATWALNMREDDQPVVLEGTAGAEPLAELDVEPDVSLVKRRDDAFHGTDLIERLHEFGADQIVLAGVSTEACIAMTAASAYAYDLTVWIADGAVASTDARAHVTALAWLEQQYRQRLVTPEDLTD